MCVELWILYIVLVMMEHCDGFIVLATDDVQTYLFWKFCLTRGIVVPQSAFGKSNGCH